MDLINALLSRNMQSWCLWLIVIFINIHAVTEAGLLIISSDKTVYRKI